MAIAESAEVEVPEKEDVLADFNYMDYREYFPEEISVGLENTLANKVFGWKSRARELKRLKYYTDNAEEVKTELIEHCTGVRKPRTVKSVQDKARTSLRNFINSLSESKLQELCLLKDVSYTSFMNANDKIGLIEAIVDEMLKGV